MSRKNLHKPYPRHFRDGQTMNPALQLSQNDREMISLLRKVPSMTVGELTGTMGVTATAVRQRLNRLMTLELAERSYL